MSQNPWWHPSDDDLGWGEPLPVIIRLAPITALLFRCGVRASAMSTGGIPSSRPRCSTGSPPGSRSSMTTTTTRPAGDPPQPGTAGLSAVVISGCLASVSRLRAGPSCNPLAVLAGQFGVAGLGPPCNPLAFRPGVAGLVLRGALHLFHSRAQEYGLDAGHAVEQLAGLGWVNIELVQGVPVLGGDLAALLLAFLRCVPVSGVGVVRRCHVGGVEVLEGSVAQRVGVGDLGHEADRDEHELGHASAPEG